MRRDVSYYLNNLSRLSEVSLEELNSWLDEMPYYQPLRYLIAKKTEFLGLGKEKSQVEGAIYFVQDMIPVEQDFQSSMEVTHSLADDVHEEVVEDELLEVDLSGLGGRLNEDDKLIKNNEILDTSVKKGYLPLFNFFRAQSERELDTEKEEGYDATRLMSTEEIKEVRSLLSLDDDGKNEPSVKSKNSKPEKAKKKAKKKEDKAGKNKVKKSKSEKKKKKKSSKKKSEKAVRDSFTLWLSEKQKIDDSSTGSKKKGKKSKKKSKQKKEHKIIKEANKSNVRDKGIISENLAIILAHQGHESEAIAMYNQLSLLFPEKSSYFAAKIEELKK